MSDEVVGTTFEAHDRRLSARKLWIAFAAEPAGTVFVDSGARAALTDRPTSLLPAGITRVVGAFESGQVVEISDGDTVFARGLASMASAEMADVAGVSGVRHVVHRDYFVLFA